MIISIRRLIADKRGGATERLMTSLNMILLAFFIVLNSFAVNDDKKIKKAWGSLLGTLGILTSGLNPGMSEGQQTLPRMAEMTTTNIDISTLMNELEKFAVNEKMMQDVNLQYGAEGVSISIANEVSFGQGGSDLTVAAKKMLDKVARILKKLEGDITVVGHTSLDAFKSGIYPDDWTVSFARAGVVARYLVSTGIIKPKRLAISGYGSTRPIIDNDTAQHRRLNNRLEIVLKRGGSG